ncbi:MAG TPA: hypothetical protein EYP48_00435 [Ignisphaera sp.]|uniref:Uncharacterized protein n=1 Tax=Ignisphaera aggregans TaxID=334771 RepID=A0A832YY71_9CREN|nr:hypothetical protein [Ignisphaera sp.]HIP56727.1 hypothetical protein [Ignisphaera aggregans]
MLEVLFSTAISAALIASAAIPMLASRSRRARCNDQRAPEQGMTVSEESVANMIKRGYAYSVDLGDSIVFVVVVEKQESKSFLTAEEKPILFTGVGDVQTTALAEVTS